ncbi:MAG: RluA family pseudouridine synthase, partial [Gammaproteobacteria bacterium]|nr:RluA family pseudouridine synthase [Gammaproteobacteria bacterium]
MNTKDNSPSVRHVEVPMEHDGQRIDNFLLHELKGVPRSLIYRILRKGEVRVNRGRIRPDYRLRQGDQVRIPPLRTPQASSTERPPPQHWVERLKDAVLFENGDVLILNKPTGFAVHKGSGVDFGVIEILRAALSYPYLELAHRLDRETSGCLILAKTPGALEALHTALREGRMDKRYLGLVKGYWRQGACEVNVPLRKNVLRGGERRVEVLADGKPALTTFKPLEIRKRASLLEISIATGRTHQIRVHAAHLEYPLAGDDKYGDPLFNREMAAIGLHRLFLHAHSVMFSLGHRDIA